MQWPHSVWLMVAVVALGCEKAPAVEESPEVFPVAAPGVGASITTEYVGKVEAVRHVEFRSRLRGVLEQQGVDEGQAVKAGQLLFSVSASEHQAELEQAKAAAESAVAELKGAQIALENTTMLFEKKVISAAEHQIAEAKVAELTARVRAAKAQASQAAVTLSWAELRAPFDGVVNRVPRKVGSLVAEGDLLTTLTDAREVFVYFRVSEREYLALTARGAPAQRQPVRLKLANGAPYAHEGVIDAVDSEFDRDSGTIAFRARFPNAALLLKHGATATVVLAGEARDSVVVPQLATFEVQENLYVYVVDEQDAVHARRIVPRVRLDDAFVLESGLGVGERIVLEGVHKLREGARITALAPVPPSASR